jgi:putative endopeptidase
MTRLQDDFYTAVNADWLESAVIPDDRPVTGGFVDLVEEVEQEERTRLAAWVSGDEETPEALAEFVQLYRLTSNWEARNTAGILPLVPLLARYQQMRTHADWQKALPELLRLGLPSGVVLSIAPDFKNTQINEAWLAAPSLILPDTTYYQNSHPQAETLLNAWREMVSKLLLALDMSPQQATELIDNALAFDEQLAQVVLSREEGSEYWRIYQPMAIDDVAKNVPFDLTGVLNNALAGDVTKVIVPEQRFWQVADQIYHENNWHLLKAWLQIRVVTAFTSYLSDDLRIIGGEYSRALSGSPAAVEADKAAFRQAHSAFDYAVGKWYGETYFGPEAKADVASMTQAMIQVYDQRLQDNTWLSQATITKAREKLARIQAHVGYPDTVPERFAKRTVDTSLGLLDNMLAFHAQERAYELSQWHQAPDPTEWHMSADTVNAYYSPSTNQIVFPAAILQAPFYSLQQSSSANFGGIGAVIAHEISHAFDTNGARFDANGNLNQWWTDDDFAAFEERTKAMVDLFYGQLVAGDTPVNGELTKSENVADLAGVAAALHAAQQDEQYDAQAFFTNFATIWRKKARPEYERLLAAMDVHGPAQYRTNLILPNFSAFHETFDIQVGDQMYQAPEQRIQIW